MVRPYLTTNGKPSILYGLNIDYVQRPAQGILSYSPPTGMVWGTMVWGNMVWGTDEIQILGWQTVGGVGNSASLRMKMLNNGSYIRFNNVDYVYQRGGLL